jgi:hypothetical protein
MKRNLFLLAILAAGHAPAAEAPGAIPALFPPERYEAMIARSPFALATPPAAVAAPPDKSFADGWYVSGIARLDGTDFVTIKSRDQAVQFSLFGNEPSNGVTLERVEWSPAIGRSTVTINKDGQAARLEFNQAEITAPTAAAPAPAQMNPGVRPQVPGLPRPVVPRPVQPGMQPPGFGGNGTIPNQPGVLVRPGNTINPAPTGEQPANRRRPRVIPMTTTQ